MHEDPSATAALLVIERKIAETRPKNAPPFGAWVWYGFERNVLAVANHLLTESSGADHFKNELVLLQVSGTIIRPSLVQGHIFNDLQRLGIWFDATWLEEDIEQIGPDKSETLGCSRRLDYPSRSNGNLNWVPFHWGAPGSATASWKLLSIVAREARDACKRERDRRGAKPRWIISLHDRAYPQGKGTTRSALATEVHEFLAGFKAPGPVARFDGLEPCLQAAIVHLHAAGAVEGRALHSARRMVTAICDDGNSLDPEETQRRAKTLARKLRNARLKSWFKCERGRGRGYRLTKVGKRNIDAVLALRSDDVVRTIHWP